MKSRKHTSTWRRSRSSQIFLSFHCRDCKSHTSMRVFGHRWLEKYRGSWWQNMLLPVGEKSRIFKLLLLIISVVYPGNAVGNLSYSSQPFKETIYRMSWKPSIECHRSPGFCNNWEQATICAAESTVMPAPGFWVLEMVIELSLKQVQIELLTWVLLKHTSLYLIVYSWSAWKGMLQFYLSHRKDNGLESHQYYFETNHTQCT